MSATDEQQLEMLLEHLKATRGFDFTGYKRSTLRRRISRRMTALDVPDFEAYLDHLEVHPEEFAPLFDSLLINVTSMFRDPEAWDHLAREIIPRIVESTGPRGTIRVWSAGCSSGEEAYTLAMLLHEALGTAAFRRRAKIYATDIDEDALAAARRAVYAAPSVAALPEELADRYFELRGDEHAFRPDLRRSVIFGRHDLIQDAPISRLSLLVCRNVLMYMNAETQARVLKRLHFALRNDGFLFLGKAEMLLTHGELFEPDEFRHRIFRPVQRHERGELPAAIIPATGAFEVDALTPHLQLLEASFTSSPLAQLVVDGSGNLAHANDEAMALFDLKPSDLDRPFQDLDVSYRPVELRSPIDRAHEERRTVLVAGVHHTSSDEVLNLEFEVIPVRAGDDEIAGVSICVHDRTGLHELEDELQTTRGELESSNQELQTTNEELETTNEELQSTNEELETTNEELQSGNEELETMNEELQSTNEELRRINEQLHERTGQLNRWKAFLESILRRFGAAMVVVDDQGMVQVWDDRARDLWGAQDDEVVGRSLFELDIGLPVDELRASVAACLAGTDGQERLTVKAIDRRGKQIRCAIHSAPLRAGDGVEGVILMMRARDGGAS